MKFVYIARIIDGCEFDRVVYEAAYSTAEAAHTWARRHYAECVEAEQPAYKHGWRMEVESFRLDWD